VRFDDRLLTVLNQPAGDRHDLAVRWRQLVDLVARAGPNSASPVVNQALDAIRSEAAEVDENLRAAAARAVAALPLPIGLLECFAADRLSVSAPVLAAAKLDSTQWRVLLSSVDEETRRFVETLHPELGSAPEPEFTETLVEPAPTPVEEVAPPPVAAPPAAASPPPAAQPYVAPSLSDVVARIERRRRSREKKPAEPQTSPAAPQLGAPALFRWECGPSGEIAWVEGAPRGALIGRSIARAQEQGDEGVDEEVVRAFAMRAPFRDRGMSVPGDGLVSGDWRISGVPAFEPNDGRFAGYRGIALREAAPPAIQEAAEILADPDSLRELVHEIKTPLNAIIGFAEIIDSQLLGPADRRYRERAAGIVAQARLLLSAIDDLDFAAKIHSSGGGAGRRVDLGDLLERIAGSVRELAEKRGASVEIAKTPRMAAAAVEPELADRLIFRLCSAVIERADRGERLRLSLDQAADQCSFSVSRPAALRSLSDAQLFDPSFGESGAASAVSLRLVRGLARIAGGDLVTSRAGLTLVFPRA
jgi:signal transduction histidine kinase